MEGGEGGEMGGGAPKSSVGAIKGAPFQLPSKPNNWSDLGGGWGKAWGGGPWRAGKGGNGGGAPESSVGATKGALVGLP